MLDHFKSFLKRIGHKPEEYTYSSLSDEFRATDLSDVECEAMIKSAQWRYEKDVTPISGYVINAVNGSYFVSVDTAPLGVPLIMKIDCKPMKRVKIIQTDYSLNARFN